MLMPSIFGEDLFDDFMGYPTGRQAAANAYPQVKDMMKTDIRDVDGNYELEIDLPGFKKEDVKIQLKNGYLNIQATREAVSYTHLAGLGLRFIRELEHGKETVRLDKVNQALAMFGKETVPGERED